MCLFIETICIWQGKPLWLDYHNRRLNRTRRAMWGELPYLDLADWIEPKPSMAYTRCRVTYDRDIRHVEYFDYSVRPIESLRLVACDHASYPFKQADRSLLDSLFALRGDASDVLIVRNGLLTDTSIANLALFDGHTWVTPAAPLLEGTCRCRLLEQGVVVPADIPAADVFRYHTACLFNAMIPFGRVRLDCHRIHW